MWLVNLKYFVKTILIYVVLNCFRFSYSEYNTHLPNLCLQINTMIAWKQVFLELFCFIQLSCFSLKTLFSFRYKTDLSSNWLIITNSGVTGSKLGQVHFQDVWEHKLTWTKKKINTTTKMIFLDSTKFITVWKIIFKLHVSIILWFF